MAQGFDYNVVVAAIIRVERAASLIQSAALNTQRLARRGNSEQLLRLKHL